MSGATPGWRSEVETMTRLTKKPQATTVIEEKDAEIEQLRANIQNLVSGLKGEQSIEIDGKYYRGMEEG